MPRARKKPPVLDAPQASHGERAALLEAQRQMPVPTDKLIQSASQPPPQGGNRAVPPGLGAEQVLRLAATQLPVRGPGLGEPTARPDEPITSGSPSGPGPGPRVMQNNVANILSMIASRVDSPSVNALAQRAAELGL